MFNTITTDLERLRVDLLEKSEPHRIVVSIESRIGKTDTWLKKPNSPQREIIVKNINLLTAEEKGAVQKAIHALKNGKKDFALSNALMAYLAKQGIVTA